MDLQRSRNDRPRRRRPASGVLETPHGPTLVFVTFCLKDRRAVLANAAMHRALRVAWSQADTWRVGRYVVMPDHVHLFVVPTRTAVPLERWAQFWKGRFAAATGRRKLWQPGCWDTRMRSARQADQKWRYVEQNPVRAGLVETAERWPFAGVLHRLDW